MNDNIPQPKDENEILAPTPAEPAKKSDQPVKPAPASPGLPITPREE